MGQMLRHRPGKKTKSRGAAGMRTFQTACRPTEGSQKSAARTPPPKASRTACTQPQAGDGAESALAPKTSLEAASSERARLSVNMHTHLDSTRPRDLGRVPYQSEERGWEESRHVNRLVMGRMIAAKVGQDP
jgi:hypothetical protein